MSGFAKTLPVGVEPVNGPYTIVARVPLRSGEEVVVAETAPGRYALMVLIPAALHPDEGVDEQWVAKTLTPVVSGELIKAVAVEAIAGDPRVVTWPHTVLVLAMGVAIWGYPEPPAPAADAAASTPATPSPPTAAAAEAAEAAR